MEDLKLEETENLIRELLARFDAAIFCGVRHNYDGKEIDRYTTRWRGPISTIRGLIAIIDDYAIEATKELENDELV